MKEPRAAPGGGRQPGPVGRRWHAALLAAAVALSACAPATSVAPDRPGGAGGPEARSPRTLTVAVRVEPVSLASKPLQDSGQSVRFTTRSFNAELDIVDGRDAPRPYLAEALPQLDTDTWRILPGGRMETTHRLKANLTWHDGAPLSAEDFAFALRVYGAPELGQSASRPQNLMEEVLAPDPRTVVIR